MTKPHTPSLIRFVVFSALLQHAVFAAEAPSSKCEAKSDGIYQVEGNGKRNLVLRPMKGTIFAESTLSVSSDGKWALIDYLPANPGRGRVEEIRLLVSLKTGSYVLPDSFKKRYGAWLDELAEWDKELPATILLGNGKHVAIH